jgi:LPXTG-motif cell wall-anchored protein
VGTLIALPFAIGEYLPGGTVTTALALVVGGLVLVAAGIYTARRRRAG